MVSNLQKQLSLQKTPKQQASLLLSRAAEVDFDLIKNIAWNSAIKLDFEKYKHFFSNNYSRIELMDPTERLSILSLIKEILANLSQHFLKTDAFNILEFLIQNFNIHSLMVDELMAMALPFHESTHFSRLLNVIDLKNSKNWAWLQPIKDNQVHLDRLSIVKRLNIDVFFLDFVLGMFSSIDFENDQNIKEISHLISFLSTTILHLVTIQTKAKDQILRKILPISFAMIKQSKSIDLQASALMIFAQLSSKFKLKLPVLTSILESNLKYGSKNEQLRQNSIKSCLVVCQNNEIDTFSIPFVKLLVSKYGLDGLDLVLRSLNDEGYDVECFMIGLIKTLIENSEKDSMYYVLLLKILQTEDKKVSLFPKKLVPMLSNHLVQVVSQSLSVEEDTEKVRLLKFLQNHYDRDLSKSIEILLKNPQTTGKSRQALYAFVSKTFAQTSFQIDQRNETTLYLSLVNPSPEVRLLALEELSSLIDKSNSKVFLDSAFLADVLIDRLGDPEVNICSFVLKFPLLELLRENREGLVKALTRVLENEAMGIENRIKAVDLLCLVLQQVSNDSEMDGFDKQVFDDAEESFFGVLYVSFKSFKLSAVALELLSKPEFPFKSLKFATPLTIVQNELSKLSDQKNSVVLERLSKSLMKVARAIGKIDSIDNKLKKFLSSKTSSYEVKILSLISLHCQMQHSKKRKIDGVLVLIPFFETLVKHFNAFSTGKNLLDMKHDFFTIDGRLPENLVLNLVLNETNTLFEPLTLAIINTILTVIDKPTKSENFSIWINEEGKEDRFVKAFRSLFLVLVQGVKSDVEKKVSGGGPFKELLKRFFIKACYEDLVIFMNHFLLNDDCQSWVKAFCLDSCTGYILSMTELNSEGLDFQLFIPTLLVSLINADKNVRSSAVNCLESIQKSYLKTLSNKTTKIFGLNEFFGNSSEHLQYLTQKLSSKFVTALLQKKQELREDPSQFPETLLSILGNCNSTGWRESVLLFFVSACIAFPTDFAKLGLLTSLSMINSSLKLKQLFSLIESLFAKLIKGNLEDHTLLIGLCRGCFNEQSVLELLDKQKKYFKLFLSLIDDSPLSFRTIIFSLITPSFFATFSSSKQLKLVNSCLGNASLVGSRKENQNAAEVDISALWEILRKMLLGWKLDASVLSAILDQNSKFLDQSLEQGSKRQRTDEQTNTETRQLFALVTILEQFPLLDITSKVSLIPRAFDLLGSIVSSQTESLPVSIEYLKQLVLSILLDLVSLTALDYVGGFRVDHVVQCIRGTDNPQTHNSSLLLMAEIAKVDADSVLVNIMPVFTFMGANVLRQDDNYSFHVIRQTLETILPALVSKHRSIVTTPLEVILAVKPIVKLFVDALFHIPKHRRLRLFTILVSVLGENEFLHPIIFLLVEKSIKSDKLGTKGLVATANIANQSVLDFAVGVSCNFNVESQLKMASEVLKLALKLAKEGDSDNEDTSFFSPSEFTRPQYLSLILSLIEIVSSVLSKKEFNEKLALFTNVQILENTHVELVQNLFSILQTFKQKEIKCNREEDSLGLKFSKAIITSLYSLLEKVHSLLSMPSFVSSLSLLLKNDDETIVNKSISLINDKLIATSSGLLTSEMSEAFTRLVPPILEIVSLPSCSNDNSISGFICLATMTQLMGKKNVEVYVKILDSVCSGIGSLNHSIAASAISCLAVLCNILGARTITHIPKFMPALSNILTNVVDSNDSGQLKTSHAYILATVSTMAVILKSIPKFVSPYVPVILKASLSPIFLEKIVQPGLNLAQSKFRQKIVDKNSELLLTLTEKVSSRILLPAFYKLLDFSIKNGGPSSLMMLFRITTKTIDGMGTQDLLDNYHSLFKFFLIGFDFKSLIKKGAFTELEMDLVDNELISSFLKFVGKLNDSMFRSLFLKIVEWATMTDRLSRSNFFYKLMDALLDKLKNLFAPYCSYVVDNALEVLKESKHSEETSCTTSLWVLILQFFYKFFLYDKEGIVNSEKFNKIYPVLVDQISNKSFLLAKDENLTTYIDQMSKFVVPCIGQLALNVHSDDLLKPLNQAIMMKSRDEDPEVRLVCLKVLEELYRLLGDDLLVLLPETIPFLAELNEDEDPKVEKLSIKVCGVIEEYLGEPLSQYFEK